MRQSITAITLAGMLLLECAAVHAQSSAQQPPPEKAFTARDASALLRQLGEALDAHSEKKMLALFDLSQMPGGPLFRQQVSALFAQSESIRVHLNLAESEAETQMAVDAEMEVQLLSGGPPSHRSERVSFRVARAGQGWKFVDVQPRSFFSLP